MESIRKLEDFYASQLTSRHWTMREYHQNVRFLMATFSFNGRLFRREFIDIDEEIIENIDMYIKKIIKHYCRLLHLTRSEYKMRRITRRKMEQKIMDLYEEMLHKVDKMVKHVKRHGRDR